MAFPFIFYPRMTQMNADASVFRSICVICG